MSPLRSCSFCVEIVQTFAARLCTSYEGFSATCFVHSAIIFIFSIVILEISSRMHTKKVGWVKWATLSLIEPPTSPSAPHQRWAGVLLDLWPSLLKDLLSGPVGARGARVTRWVGVQSRRILRKKERTRDCMRCVYALLKTTTVVVDWVAAKAGRRSTSVHIAA
jgi:hypothetical protein